MRMTRMVIPSEHDAMPSLNHSSPSHAATSLIQHPSEESALAWQFDVHGAASMYLSYRCVRWRLEK